MKTIYKNYSTSLVLGLTLVFFSVFVPSAQAAEIFFGTHAKEFGVGATFEVGVFLNTDRELINAIEGSIRFPEEILELKEIRRGNSLVNFWIEEPMFQKGGGVRYAGIVPGGYEGLYGQLFSLIFFAKKEGNVTLWTKDEKILRSDGEGSSVNITRAPLSIVVEKNGSITEFLPTTDTTPPEIFPVEISRDPNLFDGKWFAVFTAQDKGSGVARYEVIEQQQFFGPAVKGVTVKSFYVLSDQNLQSMVTVKAFDKNNNERRITIHAKNPLAWYANYENWIILIAIILILRIFGKRLWRIYKKIV